MGGLPPSGHATSSVGGTRHLTYLILRYAHLLGLTLMGAGLIGVWYTDLRSRQLRDANLSLLGELVRQIAVFYLSLIHI